MKHAGLLYIIGFALIISGVLLMNKGISGIPRYVTLVAGIAILVEGIRVISRSYPRIENGNRHTDLRSK